MPTRKIADLPGTAAATCQHPEHDPPKMMVYENGVWEHKCPSCGHKQRFVVAKPTLRASAQAITDEPYLAMWCKRINRGRRKEAQKRQRRVEATRAGGPR